MKKLLLIVLLLPFLAFGQDVPETKTFLDGVLEFLGDNSIEILAIVSYIIYRLIPTQKADVVMQLLKWLVGLIYKVE